LLDVGGFYKHSDIKKMMNVRAMTQWMCRQKELTLRG